MQGGVQTAFAELTDFLPQIAASAASRARELRDANHARVLR
jgi:hypothetical protein